MNRYNQVHVPHLSDQRVYNCFSHFLIWKLILNTPVLSQVCIDYWNGCEEIKIYDTDYTLQVSWSKFYIVGETGICFSKSGRNMIKPTKVDIRGSYYLWFNVD